MAVWDMLPVLVHILVQYVGGGAPIYVWYLCLSVSQVMSCEDRDVKYALLKCGPQLAEISTSILHSPRGITNYSHVCR